MASAKNKKVQSEDKTTSPFAPPPSPSSSDDLEQEERQTSPSIEASSDGSYSSDSAILGDEVIVIESEEPETPRPSTRKEGSFARTVSFLKKRGIDLHDNGDGSYSARFGHQARKGGALPVLLFCFSHVPHPKNRAWTEAEMQEAIENS